MAENNTYTQIHIQIVFAVKFRQAQIKNDFKIELYKYITGIVQQRKHKLIAINGMSDHIHIFIKAHPKYAIGQIVKYIKGISGRLLFIKHPEISKKLWKGHLWTNSYYVETIGSTSEENIRKYIQSTFEIIKKGIFPIEVRKSNKCSDCCYKKLCNFD